MPTMSLPTPITDAERGAIDQQISDAIEAKKQARIEKREYLRSVNGRIRGYEEQIEGLNQAKRSGMRRQDVEVRAEADFAAGLVITRRLDTQDEVSIRPITFEERQLANNLGAGQTLNMPTFPLEEARAGARRRRDSRLEVQRQLTDRPVATEAAAVPAAESGSSGAVAE